MKKYDSVRVPGNRNENYPDRSADMLITLIVMVFIILFLYTGINTRITANTPKVNKEVIVK